MSSPDPRPCTLLLELLARSPAAGLSAPELLDCLAAHDAAISQPTLSRRLAELKERGEVVRMGSRRGSRYQVDPVPAHFRMPAERRKPVNYNFTLLERYRPNQDHWLSDERRLRLHAAGRRIRELPCAMSNTIFERLLIDLSWASSYLEGNTYSLLDTERLLLDGRAASGHTARETQMILNHKYALEYVRQNAADLGPSPRELRELHALLSSGLLPNPADSGCIRRGIVEISGSSYLPITPPQQLEEQLNAILHKARAIGDPFEQALFLLVFVPYLQPFIDVNKRVGRLAANIPLFKANLCPISYRDMDKERYTMGLLAFYELNRPERIASAFLDAYEQGVERYAGLLKQGRHIHALEIRYHREIRRCVADFVAGAGGAHDLGIEAFASARFRNLDDAERGVIVARMMEVIPQLHDANYIAWGITRDSWARYCAGQTSAAPAT
jgi:Fic family protein